MNKSNPKSKSTAAVPAVTPKTAPKKPAPTATDAPMHAAKGNDDTMSQPQAARIKKKA